MEDVIIISGLEVQAHLGVPDEEREKAQRVTIFLELCPEDGLANLNDEVGNTVDYAAVCAAVLAEASRKPRKLIETLAEDIAFHLLDGFPLASVEIEVRKFIIPGTEFVSVLIQREAV